jgi:hypothetical protein
LRRKTARVQGGKRVNFLLNLNLEMNFTKFQLLQQISSLRGTELKHVLQAMSLARGGSEEKKAQRLISKLDEGKEDEVNKGINEYLGTNSGCSSTLHLLFQPFF